MATTSLFNSNPTLVKIAEVEDLDKKFFDYHPEDPQSFYYDQEFLEDVRELLEETQREKRQIPINLPTLGLSDANSSKQDVLLLISSLFRRVWREDEDFINPNLLPDSYNIDDQTTQEGFAEYALEVVESLKKRGEQLKQGKSIEEVKAEEEGKKVDEKKEDDKEKLAAVAGAVLAGRQAGTPAPQEGGEPPSTTVPPQPREQQTQQLSPEDALNFSQQNFHLNQEILRETISLENYLISAFELDKSLNLNSFPPELRELIRTQVTVTFNKLNIADYLKNDGSINITKLRFAIFKKALTQLQQNPLFLAELQLLDERKLQETSKDPNAKSEDKQHRQKVATLVSDTNISSHVEKDVNEEESGNKFSKLKDEEFKKQMFQLITFEELMSEKEVQRMITSALKRDRKLTKFPDLAFDLQQYLAQDQFDRFLILSPVDQQKILKRLDLALQNPLTLPEKLRLQIQRQNQLSEQDFQQLNQSIDLEKLSNTVVSSDSLLLIFDVSGNSKLQDYLKNLSEDARRQLIRNLQDLQAYQTNLNQQKFEQKQLADQYKKYQAEKSSILRQALKEHGIEGANAEEVIRICQDIAFSRTGAEQLADYFGELFDIVDPQITQNQELMTSIAGYTEAIKYEAKAQNHFALTDATVTKEQALEEASAYHNLPPDARVNLETTPSSDNNNTPLDAPFDPSQGSGNLVDNYKGWKGKVGKLNSFRKKLTKDRLKQLGIQVAKFGAKAVLPLGAGALIGAYVGNLLSSLGTAVGTLGGIASGALAGAAIGTVFPIIGTGVGAVVGGIGGGIAGFIGASSGASGSGLDLTAGAENASSVAKSLAKDAGSIVRNTATQATDAAGKAFAGNFATSTLPVAPIIIGTTTGILALSVYSMMTIYSAFLPDGDSSFVGYQSGEFSRYLDIDKSASPTKLENGEVATIAYTVTFTPKLGAEITVSSITDKLTALPSGQQYTYTENSEAITQISDALVNKPFTEPLTFSYSVDGVSGEDVLLTNKITANFIAKVEEQEYNEDLSSVASVRIGNPKVGCFEFASGGYNFLGNNTINWTPDEEDRVTRSFLKRAGTNETYLSWLCDKGNIKIYRLPDSSSNQWHGWAPGELNGTAFALYSRAFSYSDNSLEYTLVHELGHIMDYRNPGLRSRFLQVRRTTSCFTYPFTDQCSEYEAFAEGTVLSVVFSTYEFKGGKYNFPQRNPVEYNWFKDTIFGGLECDANSCTN